MSWQPCDDPKLGDAQSSDAIEQVIVPRARDLGGFEVRRALPSAGKQMVGPFIFFDQMGPAEFLVSEGIDVRPHPHIGLATVTYLFDGGLMHRDSLGTEIEIKPGELNLMTAGNGIVHSERTSTKARTADSLLFGIQAWAALPKSHEDAAPAFAHYDATALPRISGEGKTVRLVMGTLYGETSPAEFPHDSAFTPRPSSPPARCCRSMRTTTSARFLSCREKSTSRARRSAPDGCSSSVPATAFRSSRPRTRA